LLPDKPIVKYLWRAEKTLDGAPRPVIKGAPDFLGGQTTLVNDRLKAATGLREKVTPGPAELLVD